MSQSLICLPVHFVFSTKGREPYIHEQWSGRLYDYIGGIVKAEKCLVMAAGGMPDHIHLLVSVSRTICAADLMRVIKTNSAKWIHEQLADQPFGWQTGYGAFGVGLTMVETVRAYINRQAEHHAGQTYQDEYRSLLMEHGLEWDERYVWD